MPGNPDVSAFDVWQKVYVNCIRIASEEFFLNKKVGWAKRKKQTWERVSVWVGFLIGLWGLLVTLGILPPLR